MGIAMDGPAAVTMLGVLALVYFCPTLNATTRRHPHTMAITLINLLLGWTVIGWVFALLWSLRTPRHRDLIVPIDPELEGLSTHRRRLDERNRATGETRVAAAPRVWIQTNTYSSTSSTRREPGLRSGDGAATTKNAAEPDNVDSVACWYVGCSQLNASGAKYCSRCGRKLKAVERPTESPAACPHHLSEIMDDLLHRHFHMPRSWRRRGGP